jgi:ribosomal protein S27AE
VMKVAVLMFDNVKEIAFAGPLKVFGLSGGRQSKRLCDVFTVAWHTKSNMAQIYTCGKCDYVFFSMTNPA